MEPERSCKNTSMISILTDESTLKSIQLFPLISKNFLPNDLSITDHAVMSLNPSNFMECNANHTIRLPAICQSVAKVYLTSVATNYKYIYYFYLL